MVRIPECFEGLLPDAMVRRCIHQHHANQHYVSGYTTSFGEMDLNC